MNVSAITVPTSGVIVQLPARIKNVVKLLVFFFKYLNFFHNASIIQLLSFSLYGFARLQVILSVLAPF